MSEDKDSQQAQESAPQPEVQDEQQVQAEQEQNIASEKAAQGEPEGQDQSDQIAALNDQLLRAQAEMLNVRRRSESEIEKARKFALERFAKELLPIADNLERTISAASDNEDQQEAVKPLLEGVELTLKSFLDCMAKFKLEPIDPLGEPFDPQTHEAISMVPAPQAEPNSIIDVVQKGYSLNGRVIRAAMVVVAQG